VGINTVTLIGLMGAGKTRVGQRAAHALDRSFVDTDTLLERTAGKTVTEIFAAAGEPAFRRFERDALVTALATPGAIVSVGGGAVLDPGNVTRMRAAGPVLWLYADPVTLLWRLERSLKRGDRPLLANGDPLEVLTRLLEQRRAAYESAASATLKTDGLSVEQSAALLAGWIREHVT
jgi:shikimate kinase